MNVFHNLAIFAIVVVIVSILNLMSDFLPFPVSRIVKAIGVAVAGIVIMYIVILAWDSPAVSLLLPNLLLFGATVALATGYTVELRIPRVYYDITLGVIAVVGAFAILTSSPP